MMLLNSGLTVLLTHVLYISDVNVICAEYNELSSWWRDIRNLLIDSTNPFMALTAAIVCRAVALYVEKEKESEV
jgi:formate hydrogenlyase subunit 3/multisubunit Na+/H+ antiporter MnhD subunit